MDDFIGPVVLVVLTGLVGWVLGVAGFFSARRALREVRELQRRLQAVPAQASVAALPEPVSEPDPLAASRPWTAPIDEPVHAEPAHVEPARVEPVRVETVRVEAAIGPGQRDQAGAGWDIEALLTLRWGVWLGAAALLFAGVFLVRYAVDEGLLGPATRCVLAALLGVALIAGAEWLKRREAPASAAWAADQAPPALAAGGVAVLFGAAYALGVLYMLVPPAVAFALMAAAALAGLVVSLRHGQLVAAVGIAGAFATPALVQTEAPSMPGLFLYLLFVSAAALAVVRYTAWAWLGWATTIAGAAWVFIVTVGGSGPDAWAPALFVPAAALLNLALLPPAALEHTVGRRLAWIPFATLGAAGLLLVMIDPGWAARAGVLLLSPVAVWKAAAEPRLDRLPWLSALLVLLSLLTWALPEWQPTGEPITNAGVVLAVLPGAWAPQVIQPLLSVAALMAAFYAVAGLWFERRAAHPRRWAALVAAVPVLTLGRDLCAGRAVPAAAGMGGGGAGARRLPDRRRRRRAARRAGAPPARRDARRGRGRRAGAGLRHAALGPVADARHRAVAAAAGVDRGPHRPARTAPRRAGRCGRGRGAAARQLVPARI